MQLVSLMTSLRISLIFSLESYVDVVQFLYLVKFYSLKLFLIFFIHFISRYNKDFYTSVLNVLSTK